MTSYLYMSSTKVQYFLFHELARQWCENIQAPKTVNQILDLWTHTVGREEYCKLSASFNTHTHLRIHVGAHIKFFKSMW